MLDVKRESILEEFANEVFIRLIFNSSPRVAYTLKNNFLRLFTFTTV